VHILRGVDLDVARGTSLSVVGPSGSGKSSLLAIIGGIERRFHQGAAELLILKGADLSLASGELVALVGPSGSGKSTLLHIAALLERLGLKDRLEHRPGRLSGGEQQRVAIARALANQPGLVLADEPTGNLDPETSSHVLDLLIEITRETATAAFIATHNPDIAAAMDRTLELHDGKLRPWVAPAKVSPATTAASQPSLA
jgi:lipoprotein-releasing system ATP-binding protein